MLIFNVSDIGPIKKICPIYNSRETLQMCSVGHDGFELLEMLETTSKKKMQ